MLGISDFKKCVILFYFEIRTLISTNDTVIDEFTTVT